MAISWLSSHGSRGMGHKVVHDATVHQKTKNNDCTPDWRVAAVIQKNDGYSHMLLQN
jgi:hypothetical protein